MLEKSLSKNNANCKVPPRLQEYHTKSPMRTATLSTRFIIGLTEAVISRRLLDSDPCSQFGRSMAFNFMHAFREK